MPIKVDIKKDLGDFKLNISFSARSKRVGILGASGSGKSLTLKAVAGIEQPDEGRIELDGRILFDKGSRINIKPQNRNVGYLFQNYALFPTMSVEENIAVGLKAKHVKKEECRSRVGEMIKKFRLSGLERHLPSELSGGQEQRVALARIMAYEPSVILLDEPFSALDVYLKDRMQEELIEMLSDYEGTVIMVSHSRDEIYRFSEELVIIDRGKVERQGGTREVFENPGTKTAAALTGCKNFSAVRRIDDHSFEALDYGIVLHTEERLPEHFNYLGYRAHQFTPVWGEGKENCIRFELAGYAELQFERKYYVKPEKKEYSREAVISWFAQRNCWNVLDEKGYPDYLQFKEADFLYLK